MSSSRLSMSIMIIAFTALTPMPSQPETKTVPKGLPSARADLLGCVSAGFRAMTEIPECSNKKWSGEEGYKPKGTPKQRCCSRMNTDCARIAYNEAECYRVYSKKARKEEREDAIIYCAALGVTWTETLCDTGSGSGAITDPKCNQYHKYMDCKNISSNGGRPRIHSVNGRFLLSALIVSFLFGLSLVLSYLMTVLVRLIFQLFVH